MFSFSSCTYGGLQNGIKYQYHTYVWAQGHTNNGERGNWVSTRQLLSSTCHTHLSHLSLSHTSLYISSTCNHISTHYKRPHRHLEHLQRRDGTHSISTYTPSFDKDDIDLNKSHPNTSRTVLVTPHPTLTHSQLHPFPFILFNYSTPPNNTNLNDLQG